MFNFDAFLETLKTDLAGVIKDFREDLKEDIIHDVSSLAKKNREDLERWGNELREGNLSPEDFEFLLKSKKDLAEMEALKQKGLTQAKFDKLKADILNTMIKSMFNIKMLMNIEKIEFHYTFNDNTHSMDAVIRNSCERELLSIIQKISNELELDLSIESFAYQEGGLKEFYEIVTEKTKGNQFIIGIVAGVLISVLSHHLTRDFEIEKLEKEKIELEIQKLRHEVNEIENEQQSEQVLENAINIFTQDLKIIKHRSNYYKHLYSYRKIVSIESQTIDSEGNRSGTFSFVERNDFEKFILDSDELDSEIDPHAVIEIISPVLKKGNYKWKGTYLENGETISFYMKDKVFKNMIVNEGIAFQNGSQIICEVEKKRKLNELGEVQITDYSVTLVMEVLNKSERIITEHSKKIIKERKAIKSQLDLGLNDKE